MNYNLITNIESCYVDVPSLIYYSHIPTAIITLLMGFFVYFKNKESLSAKLLLVISIIFSLWVSNNLFAWISVNGQLVAFFWSFFVILNPLMLVACLYFLYVYIDKKDVDSWKKIVWMFLILPAIVMVPNNFIYFDSTTCEPISNKFVINLYSDYIIIFASWAIIFSIIRYRKADDELKKQIIYITSAVILFMVGSFAAAKLGDYFNNFQIEQYGLFGMTFFMGMLAYMIVKFKAFDIKLLGAQALVVTQVILIASQFAFIQNKTNMVLTGITLALTFVFGYYLIKSVRIGEERREELQVMSTKLSASNDQLRKLDNAKSEFISIASHQLRTPLTAIKGFVSLLLEGSYGKIEPNQMDALNKIYTSNERLVNLVEDLLNVSRMESGRMEFKFESCQLNDICQEVFDTFVLRAKDHKLYLEYAQPETVLPEVMVDPKKVREVVSNLVDNALKYTLDGHGGVKIKLNQVDQAIRVTISDTGIGIPQEELPYLFAKFSRGKDVSRLNTGGTGLGLYVGRGMIENNGGKIWAESDGQGLGSRFIIELPLVQSEELMKKWG